MNGAPRGVGEQPARTGFFLLLWVYAGKEATQGGAGMEENGLLSTRGHTSVRDSGNGWRRWGREEGIPPSSFQRPVRRGAEQTRAPAAHPREEGGRAVASLLEMG